MAADKRAGDVLAILRSILVEELRLLYRQCAIQGNANFTRDSAPEHPYNFSRPSIVETIRSTADELSVQVIQRTAGKQVKAVCWMWITRLKCRKYRRK